MQTELTTTLNAIDRKADDDRHSKILLSFKVILAYILKECVSEFKTCSIQKIKSCIEGKPKILETAVFPNEQNPERMEENHQEDRILDDGTITGAICFNALDPTSGNTIHLIIHIQVQDNDYPDCILAKRALYDCCSMISSQEGKVFSHSEYQKIKKVCSIWICLNAPEDKQNTIISYEMTETNLAGHIKEDPKNYDLFSAVMVCPGSFPAATDSDLLKLLSTLYTETKSPKEKLEILDQEFNIPATETIEYEIKIADDLSDYDNLGDYDSLSDDDDLSDHGSLSDYIEESGEIKGFAKGIQCLVDQLHISQEEAMEMLNVEDAEKPMYLQMLKDPSSFPNGSNS